MLSPSRAIQCIRVHRASVLNPPAITTRLFSASRSSTYPTSSGHSADSYFKDVDAEPPLDPTVHRVDSASDAVQRPYEAPSGQYSQAGVETDEYRSVDKAQPYDVPENGHGGEKLSEGPDRKGAEGRKPEGNR